MKKTILAFLIAIVAMGAVFATRISVPYNGVDYILNTSKKITDENKAYINGMFDAFTCLKEGRQLYEIQSVVASKTFTDADGKIAADNDAQKNEYELGFYDCMSSYSYGSNGDFEDVYPIYASLMAMPVSYRNAKLIVEYGGFRFYIRNL